MIFRSYTFAFIGSRLQSIVLLPRYLDFEVCKILMMFNAWTWENQSSIKETQDPHSLRHFCLRRKNLIAGWKSDISSVRNFQESYAAARYLEIDKGINEIWRFQKSLNFTFRSIDFDKAFTFSTQQQHKFIVSETERRSRKAERQRPRSEKQ